MIFFEYDAAAIGKKNSIALADVRLSVFPHRGKRPHRHAQHAADRPSQPEPSLSIEHGHEEKHQSDGRRHAHDDDNDAAIALGSTGARPQSRIIQGVDLHII